jgi:hypothetical protein
MPGTKDHPEDAVASFLFKNVKGEKSGSVLE